MTTKTSFFLKAILGLFIWTVQSNAQPDVSLTIGKIICLSYLAQANDPLLPQDHKKLKVLTDHRDQ